MWLVALLHTVHDPVVANNISRSDFRIRDLMHSDCASMLGGMRVKTAVRNSLSGRRRNEQKVAGFRQRDRGLSIFPEALCPEAVWCYETFTSMALGLAFSSLGKCTIKTPSLNSADIFSARAPSGSMKLRVNAP